MSETESQGVCPECGTNWYLIMGYDETMKPENINYCPKDGERLDE